MICLNEMVILPRNAIHQQAFLTRLEEEAQTDISLCYQCGKCSAGCPATFAMDYSPRKIIRLLQLGLYDKALESKSIWICATCETCSTRCPRGVDIAALMDALRREALLQGKKTDKKVAAFNRAFLGTVRKYGKVHELGLMVMYNTLTGQFLKDAELGLPMMSRGKVSVFPEKVAGREEIQKIFDRVKQLEGE